MAPTWAVPGLFLFGSDNLCCNRPSLSVVYFRQLHDQYLWITLQEIDGIMFFFGL